MAASPLPINGFIGTGATFAADINLVVPLAMGASDRGLTLAKHKRYKAHGACQTTVFLSNLWVIGFEMGPPFRQQVAAPRPKVLHSSYYAIATIHAALGSAAELMALYIVLVAATYLVPRQLRFNDWKRWMRIELLLWSVALVGGLGTYYAWYIAPFGSWSQCQVGVVSATARRHSAQLQ